MRKPVEFGTSLCNECELAGQLLLQPVSVVSLLDHLSLQLPQLKFRRVHDILQRRPAVGIEADNLH